MKSTEKVKINLELSIIICTFVIEKGKKPISQSLTIKYENK